MDLNDLPAYLEGLKKAAGDAAVPAVNAMAGAFQYRVKNVTLKQVAHGPGVFHKAVAFRPPAYASGVLSRSIVMRPASGGNVSASALVSATAKYAQIQELGGSTWPARSRYLHWTNDRGSWYMRSVTLPPHPYMSYTVQAMVRDGSLTREAMSAFYARVSPFFNR